MAGIPGIGSRLDMSTLGRSRNVLDLFSSRQNAGKSGNSRNAYQLGSAGARIAAREGLARSEARVLKAADALRNRAPTATRETTTSRERTGTDRISSTTTISNTAEVTTPATAAAQFSLAFDSADETIALVGSRLQFRVSGGSNVRIDVGASGASLQDIADLINEDEDNAGRLEASVISSPEGFRLQVETTDTGRSARLRIRRDDFTAPLTGTPSSPAIFGDYELIDEALEVERGSNAFTETVTTTEDVTTYRDVSRYADVKQTALVEDEDFEALSREFAEAFNALRSQISTALEPSGPGHSARLLADDPNVLALSESLSTLTEEFGASAKESGSGLDRLGLGVDDNGDLQIDPVVFQNALVDQRDEIFELFTSTEGGLVQQAKDLLLREPEARPFDRFTVFDNSFRDADASAGSRGRFQVISDLFQIQARRESD